MIDLRKGVEIGGYVLDEPLATGGMGQVYVATDPVLARRVALKLIRTDLTDTEQMRQRFIIEARSTAAIEHPNVVHIYAVGQVDGMLYIAMQLIDGPSLKDVITKEVFLEPQRAVPIVCQVASALAVAHERGLVHRDVKPANILLARHGDHEHAYLADFGLARVVAVSGLTRSGQSIGTPAYMSPEQVRGEAGVDGRADIYGLGCVLFEALTGEVPFPRNETHAVYYAHMEAPPPLCSEGNTAVPSVFDGVLARALAKSPGDRFASAAEFEDACRAALIAGEEFVAESPAHPGVETLVLVRQVDAGPALIHTAETCERLDGAMLPPRTIEFGGPGTAGWISLDEALLVDGAQQCRVCMGTSATRDFDGSTSA